MEPESEIAKKPRKLHHQLYVQRMAEIRTSLPSNQASQKLCLENEEFVACCPLEPKSVFLHFNDEIKYATYLKTLYRKSEKRIDLTLYLNFMIWTRPIVSVSLGLMSNGLHSFPSWFEVKP